jgi:iron complex outermembrane receptor protein
MKKNTTLFLSSSAKVIWYKKQGSMLPCSRKKNRTFLLMNLTVAVILLCAAQMLSAQEILEVQQTQEARSKQDSISTRAEQHAHTHRLKDVTVTAERRAERLQSVPISVSALSAESLQSSGIQTLRGITARVPNLFMPDYGTRLTAPVFMRGIGSRINDPSVGLYVDGVNYFDRSAFDFELYDIERIEVLRGPQGTLFGRNTMGGIIHVVTEKPSAKRMITGSMGYGAFNDQQYRLTGQMPVVGNELFARMSLARNSRNGFTTNQFSAANSSGGGSVIDFRDGWSGRVQLRWLPDAAWDLQATVYGERDRDGGTPYAPLERTRQQPFTANFNGASTFHRDMLGASLRAIYDLKSFRLTSATSWQSIENRFAIDQDFDPRDIINVFNSERQMLLTQELTASSYYRDSPVQWILGVFAFAQNQQRDIELGYGRDAIGFVQGISSLRTDTRGNSQRVSGVAAFGQITANDLLVRGLGVTLGVRYDAEWNTLLATRFVQILQTQQRQDFPDFSQPLAFSEILPKILLKYAANEDVMLYASVSKGYKGGGFNVAAIEERDRTFGAEQSWNYELGAKTSWLENRIVANVSAFWIDWTNQQVTQVVPPVGNLIRNAGRTVSRGAELDVSARPVPQILVSAAFGYTDARFASYTDQQFSRNAAGMTVARTIDYAGNRVPFVPEYTANLAAEYDIRFTDKSNNAQNPDFISSLSLRAELQSIGRTFWREDNSTALVQDPYHLLNARATLHTSIGRFAVWANNLTDTRFTTLQFASLPNLPLYAQLGAPRSVGVQYSFTIAQ